MPAARPAMPFPRHRRLFGAALLSGLMLAEVTPAAAQRALPLCTLGDADWRADPVLTASRHPSQRHRPPGPLICRTVENSEGEMGGARLQILRAKVFEGTGEGEGIQQPVNLIVLTRHDAAGTRELSRFLVPYDISRDEPSFFPMLNKVGDAHVLQLGERIATAYRIVGDAVTPFDSHAWQGTAAAAAGPDWVTGTVRRVDFMHGIGFISVYRKGADDPATPGSAFDPGRAVQVKLAFEGDRLVARDPAVVETQFIQDVEDWTAFVERQEEARLARRRLPAGTEPCQISGWSLDTDPAGLNVRAAPAATARVVGRVPPPWNAPGRDGDPGQAYRAEFEIIGYRDGWFHIRAIKAPGVDYGERYPRSRPQPYRGQGWVSARLVGAALANGNLPPGQLYQAPSRNAAVRRAVRPDGEPVSTGDEVKRLLACSDSWGLVEIEGVRGWWSGICSNQVTNCS